MCDGLVSGLELISELERSECGQIPERIHCWKAVVQPALDVRDAPPGPRAGVRLGQERHLVGQLVADRRQQAVDDVGHQQLRCWRARRDRPALRVHRLVDGDVPIRCRPEEPGKERAMTPTSELA